MALQIQTLFKPDNMFNGQLEFESMDVASS